MNIPMVEERPQGSEPAKNGSTASVTDDGPMLVPVALQTITPTAVLDYDIYLWANDISTPVLYRERSLPFTRSDIDRLLSADILTIFLPVDDHASYRRQLLDGVIDNKDVPPVDRYRALKELNRRVFEAALQGRNLNRVVEVADSHASRLAGIICDRALVLDDMFRLMDHDYYTYTHATNVCVYSIILAHQIGISDETVLSSIGTAALLHDLGKRHIPLHVLNKPGKLNDAEWDMIQEHPRNAFDELAARDDLNWDQLMLIYQHHERLNGTGYPVGLGGDEVHDWAKICAIADVFDALTSDRPYRKPDSPEKAFALFKRLENEFDKEMVKCWISTVSRSRS